MVEIPDDIVARAVIARGHAPDRGGIGAAMRAALEAVAEELGRLACPRCGTTPQEAQMDNPNPAGHDPTTTAELPLPTTDPQVWAREFVRLHGGDEGLMISWFTHAMKVGADAGYENGVNAAVDGMQALLAEIGVDAKEVAG